MSYKLVRNLKVSSTILRFWSRVSGRQYCATKKQTMSQPFKTLKDLGYGFNQAGELRKLDAEGQITDQPFDFDVSNLHLECQSHYEEVGTAITEHIYNILESELNFIRLRVPKDDPRGTCVFATKDYDTNDILLILINGSGAVRAGQWARSLIINNNLDMGSQIPYIKCALSRGFAVLVLNPNDNFITPEEKIPHSGTAEEHVNYVWDNYVRNTKATSLVVIAHSYGGVLTVQLADRLKDEFENRVKAIAFTDSVHVFANIRISKHLQEVSRNWMSSNQEVNSPMNTPDYDISRVSAGTQKHELTSYSCMDSVFKFIDEKLAEN